jgi:hypothetical protein
MIVDKLRVVLIITHILFIFSSPLFMRTPNQLGRPGPLKPTAPSGVLVRMKKISRVVAFMLAGGLLITPTRPSRKAAPQQVTGVKAAVIKKEIVELPKLKEIKAIR